MYRLLSEYPPLKSGESFYPCDASHENNSTKPMTRVKGIRRKLHDDMREQHFMQDPTISQVYLSNVVMRPSLGSEIQLLWDSRQVKKWCKNSRDILCMVHYNLFFRFPML